MGLKLNKDYFNNFTPPEYILCKANRDKIGVLKCTSKTLDIKYNEPDEITFTTYMMYDTEKNPYYDAVDIMKYILLPNIGFFSISSVDIHSEGSEFEYKEVTAKSYECLMGQKYLENFSINTKVEKGKPLIDFYNLSPSLKDRSLLHLIISEKCPDWKIGTVSKKLQTLQRTFEEVERQDIYSFLMNDVATAFGCVFHFNTLTNEISAYLENEVGKDTNIHVSYNNLLKKTDISCSIDDIKTCLTVKGQDDMSIRDVNLGFDRIIDVSYYHDLDYMSEDLYHVCNKWWEAQKNNNKSYQDLLGKKKETYKKINELTYEMMPKNSDRETVGYGTFPVFSADGTESENGVIFTKYKKVFMIASSYIDNTVGDEDALYVVRDTVNGKRTELYRYSNKTKWFNTNTWQGYGLSSLKEYLTVYENQQNVEMKAGNGKMPEDVVFMKDGELVDVYEHNYYKSYLPICKTIDAIKAQIEVIEDKIKYFEDEQNKIQHGDNTKPNDKGIDGIIEATSFETAVKNYNNDSNKKCDYQTLWNEFNTFLKEDELNTENYIITNTMNHSEKMEQYENLLEFGEKELKKVSTPQLSFTADMVNIHEIPEFEHLLDDFDIGNSIMVSLRDDYKVRARILSIHLNFYDITDFSVKFGNIAKSAKTRYTDVTNMIKAGVSAATSLSYNSTRWNNASDDSNYIMDMLSNGLKSANASLKNAPDADFIVDRRGVFINTISGDYAGKDSIFFGNSSVLFTQNNWDSVAMAIGRAEVNGESKFGVFADFVIAGYIAASTIEGSKIIGGTVESTNYQKGKYGTFINLEEGSFEFNGGGEQKLTLSANGTLTAKGTIKAEKGYIGGENGFTIESKSNSGRLYSGKSSLANKEAGIYIGTNGIALGVDNPFKVDINGNLTATSATIKGTINADAGYIGGENGFKILSNKIYNGKYTIDNNSDGIYIGTDGIALGANSLFKVDKLGNLTAKSGTIGGWEINASSLSATKEVTRKDGSKIEQKLVINKDGSIYAQNKTVDKEDVESIWSISSSGYAYFRNISLYDNVKIGTGKDNNNKDVGITVNKDGMYGGFGNGFYANGSFALRGDALDNFNDLVVNNITAENIKATKVLADYVTTTTLTTDYMTAKDIKSTFIDTEELKAHTITADKLTAGTVNGNSVSWQSINVVTGASISTNFMKSDGSTGTAITMLYTKPIYVMAAVGSESTASLE